MHAAARSNRIEGSCGWRGTRRGGVETGGVQIYGGEQSTEGNVRT
uniref:Uncharacterized protein n=1 Tax=Arundo donax TaxID=35708 RepID=A0A0A9FXN7_ARUDO